jgi:hypothetical protein
MAYFVQTVVPSASSWAGAAAAVLIHVLTGDRFGFSAIAPPALGKLENFVLWGILRMIVLR